MGYTHEVHMHEICGDWTLYPRFGWCSEVTLMKFIVMVFFVIEWSLCCCHSSALYMVTQCHGVSGGKEQWKKSVMCDCKGWFAKLLKIKQHLGKLSAVRPLHRRFNGGRFSVEGSTRFSDAVESLAPTLESFLAFLAQTCSSGEREWQVHIGLMSILYWWCLWVLLENLNVWNDKSYHTNPYMSPPIGLIEKICTIWCNKDVWDRFEPAVCVDRAIA